MQPDPARSPGNPTPQLNRAAAQARTTSPPESWPRRCHTRQPGCRSWWGLTDVAAQLLPSAPRTVPPSCHCVMAAPARVVGRVERSQQHQESFQRHTAARGQRHQECQAWIHSRSFFAHSRSCHGPSSRSQVFTTTGIPLRQTNGKPAHLFCIDIPQALHFLGEFLQKHHPRVQQCPPLCLAL